MENPMFEEEYNRLSMADQENFKRVINVLLAHSYLYAEAYDFKNDLARTDPDYLFVERHFSLFQDYLGYAGFQLLLDRTYGVIALTSAFDANRVHFNKFTTLTAYTLRLIYEEEREKLSLSDRVVITTGDLIEKMMAVGAIDKKPADQKIGGAMRTLARFRIVTKPSGHWEEAETRILILPTILFIVSNEQIADMHKLIKSAPEENSFVDEETGEADSDEDFD